LIVCAWRPHILSLGNSRESDKGVIDWRRDSVWAGRLTGLLAGRSLVTDFRSALGIGAFEGVL
jgi:hypothetical protein